MATTKQRRKAITKAEIKELTQARKAFKPRKKLHPMSELPGDIAHTLDEDLIAKCRSKQGVGDNILLNIFDPALDSSAGTYHIQWTDDDVRTFWEGYLMKHLSFLRCAEFDRDSDTDEVTMTPEEVLEWFTTQHFDEVCEFLDLDANEIRCQLPGILARYNKGLSQPCKRIIAAFNRLKNYLYEKPTHNPISFNF